MPCQAWPPVPGDVVVTGLGVKYRVDALNVLRRNATLHPAGPITAHTASAAPVSATHHGSVCLGQCSRKRVRQLKKKRKKSCFF